MHNPLGHSMKPGSFVEVDGRVHLTQDSEHLLCNTATFDAADTEDDESLRWKPTKAKAVTCEPCIAIIQLCRGVRVTPDKK